MQPSFLGVITIITHILGVENLHFSWFGGPRVGVEQIKLPLIVNVYH